MPELQDLLAATQAAVQDLQQRYESGALVASHRASLQTASLQASLQAAMATEDMFSPNAAPGDIAAHCSSPQLQLAARCEALAASLQTATAAVL